MQQKLNQLFAFVCNLHRLSAADMWQIMTFQDSAATNSRTPYEGFKIALCQCDLEAYASYFQRAHECFQYFSLRDFYLAYLQWQADPLKLSTVITRLLQFIDRHQNTPQPWGLVEITLEQCNTDYSTWDYDNPPPTTTDRFWRTRNFLQIATYYDATRDRAVLLLQTLSLAESAATDLTASKRRNIAPGL